MLDYVVKIYRFNFEAIGTDFYSHVKGYCLGP